MIYYCKCGEEIEVSGDYPELSAECEKCGEEADNGDLCEDYVSTMADVGHDYYRDKQYGGLS